MRKRVSVFSKKGVVSKGEFCDSVLLQEAVSGGVCPFAYTLLADLEESYDAADEPLLQRIYQSMEAGDTVIKVTRCNRLSEVDKKLAGDLPTRFPMCDNITIHDFAASNAITSLDMYNVLKPHFTASIHASDYYDKLYLVSPSGSEWTVVFDANRMPLQIVGGNYVLAARRKQRSYYPVNLAIEAWTRLTVLPNASKVLDSVLPDQRGQLLNDAAGQVREVWLFHPRCVALSKENRRFTLGHRDIFKDGTDRYHVVRLMNVLNIRYFSRSEIIRGIRACATDLLPGGLFVIGRSIDEEDSRPRTTAFVMAGDRLVPTWDLHEGSEIKELVSQIKF